MRSKNISVSKMVKVYVLGCGGHARSIADTLAYCDPSTEIIFVDVNAKPDEKVLGFNLVKQVNDQDFLAASLFIGIGDNAKRKLAFEVNSKYNIVSIISPLSYVSKTAQIGKGCFLGNYCHIGPEAIIGENTIINTAAVIEHGVSIGKHSHIAPNVAISGNTTIGNNVFIGVGASIIDKLSICDDVIIGAGATVIKNITESGVYAGTPAKKIK